MWFHIRTSMNSADTIIPVYFPFTTMSQSVGAMLYTCFNASAVYALSDKGVDSQRQQWSEAGWLDIRIPVGMDPMILGSVLDRYQSWADQQGEEGIAYMKTQGSRAPLSEDPAISEIIGAVRGNKTPPSREEDRAPHGVDRRMHAGLFLHAAEIFDAQKSDMSDNLRHIKRMEADLFSDLREDDDPVYGEILGDGMVIDEDTGHYMVAERITSWARLVADDPKLSGFFITSSPAVLAYLLDKTTDAEMVLELDHLESLEPSDKRPAAVTHWQSRLNASLDSLLKGPVPASADDPGPLPGKDSDNPLFSLVVYMIPGQRPYELFGKLAGVLREHSGATVGNKGPENTLIGGIFPTRKTEKYKKA